MIRTSAFAFILVAACSTASPQPGSSTPPGPAAAAPTGTRDLTAAAKRFQTGLSAGRVDGLLGAQVTLENGNAAAGCKEPAEPCVHDTLTAADAAKRLTQQIEGYTFGGPDERAAELGCDAACCHYGPFRHGDTRVAIASVCFDDAADPKIIKIIGD